MRGVKGRKPATAVRRPSSYPGKDGGSALPITSVLLYFFLVAALLVEQHNPRDLVLPCEVGISARHAAISRANKVGAVFGVQDHNDGLLEAGEDPPGSFGVPGTARIVEDVLFFGSLPAKQPERKNPASTAGSSFSFSGKLFEDLYESVNQDTCYPMYYEDQH